MNATALQNREAMEPNPSPDLPHPFDPTQRFQHRNGWLDPDGRFHPLDQPNRHCEWCVNQGFQDCQAKRLGETGCKLELDGWFKLTDGKWVILYPHKTTQRQCNYLFDWHIANEQPLDEFMTLMKEVMPPQEPDSDDR